jgi:hypothetical protein
MPPDSDTIEVQTPNYLLRTTSDEDLASDNERDLNTQLNETMETDYPTTPIEQNTQRSIFDLPTLLKPNKRIAQFSPEIEQRERAVFPTITKHKPIAKDADQAIYWARDLILQATTMATTQTSQNKLLEILDVFRDYTEKGKVTNLITDKLSAQLAYHTATLTNASQQATRTLKRAVKDATTTPNNNQLTQPPQETPDGQIGNQPNNQPSNQPSSPTYANIAAQNNNGNWNKVPTRKKSSKKPRSYYQVVLTLEQRDESTPLQIRDKINKAFVQAGINNPVVQEVSTSRRNNIILTTTAKYSGEFLLQYKHIWHQLFELKNAQLLESWTKIIVHNVPTNFEGSSTLEILHSEIPAYNKGVKIVGNPYWLTRDWQSKKNSSVVIAFRSAEEAAILGTRVTILGQTLQTEKFQATTATTQCSKCQSFGHNEARCRNQPICNLCAQDHPTITHKCLVCNAKGKPCNHTLPKCHNCQEPHFASSKQCEIFKALASRDSTTAL